MSQETSKAMRRRWYEHEQGVFPWRDIFHERNLPALDIGSGDDPLPRPLGAQPFDQEHGDANKLGEYFAAGSFGLLHASQCLEHLHTPADCVAAWLNLLRAGGFLVVTVPCWELYEHRRPKSIWNPDHKTTWSMLAREGGGVLPHIFVPDFLKRFRVQAVQLARMIDFNYDYKIGGGIDQTLDCTDAVEPWIEFVLQK